MSNQVEEQSVSPNSGNALVVGIPKRSLKFRCWDVFNQRMVNNPYLFEPKPDYLDNPEPYQFYETWQDVEDGIGRLCHVMQFTGLVDKNGVEIYEGDIVKSGYQADEAHAITVDDFHGFRFMIGKNQLVHDDAMDGEVIGNVFQNPELLG